MHGIARLVATGARRGCRGSLRSIALHVTLMTAVASSVAAAGSPRPIDEFLVVGEGVRVVGHRGAAAHAPENTIASFRRAFADGARMVELDVGLTSDGVPVCIHDRTVRRTTDGRGAVDRLRAADITALDAGSWFSPRFRGERVPTLADALTVAGAGGLVNVEVKPVRDAAEAERVVAAVLGAVRGAGMTHRVLLSSFDRRVVAALVGAGPEVRVALVVERRRSPDAIAAEARRLGVDAVHLHRSRATPELVAACHHEGLPVGVFTVNDPAEAVRLARHGVDYLFSDDPGAILAALTAPAGR